MSDIFDTLPAIAERVALDLFTAFGVGVLVVLLHRGVRRGCCLFSRLISSQVRFALVCWPVATRAGAGLPPGWAERCAPA